MKKAIILTVLSVVVLVCIGAAIVVNQNRKDNVAQSPTVKSLQAQLKASQDVQQEHDATNTAALHNAGTEIVSLTQVNTTLCTQIKTAHLVQPLCK